MQEEHNSFMILAHVLADSALWYGMSTAFILQGLHDNGSGELHSIDLPDASWIMENGSVRQDSVGDEKNTGSMVPDFVRCQWHLTLGSTQDKLVPLLQSLGEADLFIHDSGHTYRNMLFEFKSAWAHLRWLGVLVSDMIHENRAFHDFARSVPCRSREIERRLNERMGILVKTQQ